GLSPATKPSQPETRSVLPLFADEAMALQSESKQAPTRQELVAGIRARASAIRRDALKMVFEARQGHPGGDMSVADILATLYLGVLRIDPKAPRAPDRDRLILSKGHASGALYATLAEAGFI